MLWDKREESQSKFNSSQAERHPYHSAKYPYHTAPNPNPGLPSLHEMYPFLSHPVQQTTSKPEPPMYEQRGSDGPKTSAYTEDVNSAHAPLYAMSQREQPDSRYQIATVNSIPATTTNSYSLEQKLLQELEQQTTSKPEPPMYEQRGGNGPKMVAYTGNVNSADAPLYAKSQEEQPDPRYQIATVKPIPATTTNSYAREQKLLQELELLPQQQPQDDVYDGAPLHLVQEGATTPPPAQARMTTTPLFLAYQNIRK